MDLETRLTKPDEKKRDEIRVEIPVGESRVFPDGRRYRFVAGGGCNDCAFFLPRAVSPLGAGTAETHCLATARTVAAGDPIYPCSQYSRRDGLYGHFERVDPARSVCDFVQSETFVRRLRQFAYGVALALALIAAIAIFGAFHSALANDEVADLPAVAFAAGAADQTPEPVVVPAALYEPRYVETFDDVHRATCRVVCVDSTGRGASGTGTVVGYDPAADAFEILTNYHVVQGFDAATLHFFGEGNRRVDVENVPVVATFYDEKLPIDAAILKTPRVGGLAEYDPPVAPLAPEGYRPKEGALIWSAGCPEGRWASAWKGGVESYYGETTQFFPAPKGGQSGSAIVERTPLGLRVVALLTWLFPNPGGSEKERGGAIPIAKLYEAVDGRRATGEIDSIPPNAVFCGRDGAAPVRATARAGFVAPVGRSTETPNDAVWSDPADFGATAMGPLPRPKPEPLPPRPEPRPKPERPAPRPEPKPRRTPITFVALSGDNLPTTPTLQGPPSLRLVYFSQKNCPACAAAPPILTELDRAGYFIEEASLDDPLGKAVAARFGVAFTPSFLLLQQATSTTPATTATALELWYGTENLDARVRAAFAKAARLPFAVPPLAPAPPLPTPEPNAVPQPQAPLPPAPETETAYPLATSPTVYFKNVAFAATVDEPEPLAAFDDACPDGVCPVPAPEAAKIPFEVAPSAPNEIERAPGVDASRKRPSALGEIAPVSRGGRDAETLLDRYRDGFRGGNGGGDDGSNEAPAAPAPSSGPIVAAIERAARSAFEQIAADATATINEKAAEFETSARRTMTATAGKIAFWGALCAAGWFWAVRILGAVATRIFQRLPRLRLEIEEPPK